MPESFPEGGPVRSQAAPQGNPPVTSGPAVSRADRSPPYRGPGGFLLLDKPAGISSFQALRPVKRAFPKAKVGHAGTLDPAASGLLIAGVASATRLLEYLEGMPKTYAFTAHFGFVSDTYDLEGRVEPSGTRALESLTPARIESALAAFRGRIRQVPPAYSAIKVGGERAYALARAGEEVALEAREVEVSALEMKAFRPGRPAAPEAGPDGGAEAAPDPVTQASLAAHAPCADFVMTCSKGTYVRSVVHDLGRALGCGAVTGGLRRLAIGPYRAEAAVAPEAVSSATPLLPPESAVGALPRVDIPRADEARFRNGQAVTVELPWAAGAAQDGTSPQGSGAGLPSPGAAAEGVEVRAHASDGRLLAIAMLSAEGKCSPRKVFAGEGA
jgi:tRNA pseudouridine55 synthase